MAFFKKKAGKTESKKKPTVKDLKNVPLTAYEAARKEWNVRNGDTVVNQSRLFVLCVFMLVALVGMAFALKGLSPLKSVVPYTIEVDRVSGETRAVGITANRFIPDQNQKSYFLSQWATQLLSLDPFMSERHLTEAFGMVRGKAIEEFREFMSAERPIQRVREDQSLTRTININNISFINDNVVQIRATGQERSANRAAPPPTRYVVTMHYVIDPPKTEQEILRNPIGIFVTHFSITEEFGQ